MQRVKAKQVGIGLHQVNVDDRPRAIDGPHIIGEHLVGRQIGRIRQLDLNGHVLQNRDFASHRPATFASEAIGRRTGTRGYEREIAQFVACKQRVVLGQNQRETALHRQHESRPSAGQAIIYQVTSREEAIDPGASGRVGLSLDRGNDRANQENRPRDPQAGWKFHGRIPVGSPRS